MKDNLKDWYELDFLWSLDTSIDQLTEQEVMHGVNLTLQTEQTWINQHLPLLQNPPEPATASKLSIAITVVDADEMRSINLTHRQKDKPTNVLSFPGFSLTPWVPHLGDVIICDQIVRNEAVSQEKPYNNHWMHMLVHGILHLMGYDHINDDDARQMESLEVTILGSLGD